MINNYKNFALACLASIAVAGPVNAPGRAYAGIADKDLGGNEDAEYLKFMARYNKQAKDVKEYKEKGKIFHTNKMLIDSINAEQDQDDPNHLVLAVNSSADKTN